MCDDGGGDDHDISNIARPWCFKHGGMYGARNKSNHQKGTPFSIYIFCSSGCCAVCDFVQVWMNRIYIYIYIYIYIHIYIYINHHSSSIYIIFEWAQWANTPKKYWYNESELLLSTNIGTSECLLKYTFTPIRTYMHIYIYSKWRLHILGHLQN